MRVLLRDLELKKRIGRHTLNIVALALVVPKKDLSQAIICEVLVITGHIRTCLGMLQTDDLPTFNSG